MPKGHRRTLGLGAEWYELDKSLSAAVRRYRAFADRLVREPLDESVKAELKGFLERNPLERKKTPDSTKKDPPPILSDRERLLERCGRTLRSLSEANQRNLYELAKSMGRVERARYSEVGGESKPEKARPRARKPRLPGAANPGPNGNGDAGPSGDGASAAG
jgi:hypothetical protein